MTPHTEPSFTNPAAGAPADNIADAGIVSVNSRGATSNDLAKKILFLAVILAIILVGGLWFVNHWRANARSDAEHLAAVNKNETKPAQVGIKRVFEEPPRAAVGIVSSTQAAALPTAPPCKDIMVLDPQGRPVMGANGQPILVGCDGKVIVPAIGAPGGTANMTPGTTPTTAPSKPPSRYVGDVLILAAPGGSAAPSGAAIPGQASPTNRATTADVLPLLTSLVRQQRGEAPSSAGQGVERVASIGGPPGGVYRAQATANATDTATTDVNVSSARTGVSSLLTPTQTPKVTASMIGDRNMLLTKGTHIDCALAVKIINEVSGFASCVLPSNVYSHNGKVLLLERASEVQGEYTAQLRQGQRRLFVLWDRVTTPNGVVISFASPAADSLGTMGIDGYVDNRWWDRLGAAFLLSFVKDVIGYQIAKDSQGANSQPGGLAYQNSVRTGESMADRILSQTINIPPTIYKNQGDLASIYVARDLDFSTVYTLKAN